MTNPKYYWIDNKIKIYLKLKVSTHDIENW